LRGIKVIKGYRKLSANFGQIKFNRCVLAMSFRGCTHAFLFWAVIEIASMFGIKSGVIEFLVTGHMIIANNCIPVAAVLIVTVIVVTFITIVIIRRLFLKQMYK
jgi:uncharacterized membrane protein (DUF2068 family)